MAASGAPTVAAYLKALPDDRRAALKEVRAVVRAHLPPGYAETMQYGMIGYVVPLRLYPAGYLGKPDVPLPYAALGAQKRHLALYLMGLYGDATAHAWFVRAYKATGKRLDMGKACLRFRTPDDLPLDVVGDAIARVPVEAFIRRYEQVRGTRR